MGPLSRWDRRMTSRPAPDHDETPSGTGIEVLVALVALLLPEEERDGA
jgi:hypothetical protein